MAVIRVWESQEAASGGVDKMGNRQYAAPYLCQVDSAYDGPVTIMNHLSANGPWPGDSFRYGNETDSTVLCTGISSPKRVSESTDVWTFVATYSTPDPADDKPDDNGEPSDTPNDWRMHVSVNTSPFSVPVRQAWNVDPIPVPGKFSSFVRPAFTYGPVVNSAGVPYDPPLMKEDNEIIYRIKGFTETLKVADLDWPINNINSVSLRWVTRLQKYYGLKNDKFEAFTLKCTSVAADVGWWRDLVYYTIDYEFRYRHRAANFEDPVDGWLEYVLDRGNSRLAGAGDPDGRGGTVSALDLKDGVAHAAPILDVDGRRVSEAILLDGAGQPATGDDLKNGVWFEWKINSDDADFTKLAIPIFMSGV